MDKVLVTGGHGILGSQLIPRLIAAGYSVRSASRSVPGTEADPRVEWMQADLGTGQGLAEAISGVDVIVHAASAGMGDSYIVDVEGTKRLLEAASKEGVKHFVYISIVGIDKSSYKYYQHKLAAEQIIEASGMPYSILRAVQFHSLIDIILKRLTQYPIAIVDTGWKLQPIDEGEVAQRLAEIVTTGPSGHVPDIAGPEIRMMGDLTRAWLSARGMKRLIVPLPLPGELWSTWRQGLTIAPSKSYGQITWEEWLAARYGDKREKASQPITGRKAA